MTWRTRRILALVLLLVWLPIYLVAALVLTGWMGRQPALIEMVVYAGLGVLWALPFRRVFLGIGREDPDRAGRDGGRDD